MAQLSPKPGSLCGPDGRLPRTVPWAAGRAPSPFPRPHREPFHQHISHTFTVTVPSSTRLCFRPHILTSHSHTHGTEKLLSEATHVLVLQVVCTHSSASRLGPAAPPVLGGHAGGGPAFEALGHGLPREDRHECPMPGSMFFST